MLALQRVYARGCLGLPKASSDSRGRKERASDEQARATAEKHRGKAASRDCREREARKGDAAQHLLAFDRGGAITLATRLPLGLERRGGWGEASVTLQHPVVDAFTGARYDGDLKVGDVLGHYPVALLLREK